VTPLRKGQHYDNTDPSKVRDATLVLSAIKKHLQEKECNHTLKEILEEEFTK
jgi:hypothetical protein